MPQTAPWTIGRLLRWTSDYLRRHGSDSSRLDAEILLAEALGCRRIDLYTRYDEVPDDAARTAFRGLVRRRAEGTPVAYLVGRREFYSLNFRVTPDVLIPRPETELVVVTLIDLARQYPADRALKICDVGTGSGVIAVCAAKHLPHARVTAVDISPAALAVARANAEEHGVAERIEFVQGDLMNGLAADERFELVASNPPYVSQREMEQLSREVRDFEPTEALLAGPRGTEVIEALVAQAAWRLQPGGRLVVEINPALYRAACELIERDGRLVLESTVKDLGRQPRVIQVRRK
ncbi:MAG TPA: peptide chain release factor N(5)-glutamine methyltransferase [Planctomycetes bacterium]|nr:peptide chain release factor N(5)-glutamine methyltransferase [Planctomycetota bacterium]